MYLHQSIMYMHEKRPVSARIAVTSGHAARYNQWNTTTINNIQSNLLSISIPICTNTNNLSIKLTLPRGM